MSRAEKKKAPRRRKRHAAGPMTAGVARWVPLVTVGGALALSWSWVVSFVHGDAGVVGVLARLALGAAVCYASLRCLLAVIEHYERDRPPEA